MPINILIKRILYNQTSDNMDRQNIDTRKAEIGSVREEKRRKEKKNEYQLSYIRETRRKSRHEKVGKSKGTVFFQWCVALGGQKVGLLKRLVRSQVAKWEVKSCAWLRREQGMPCSDPFGNSDVEKMQTIGTKQISKWTC